MNIDKDFVTLARQWHTVLERAAFIEGIDKVKLVLEREQEVGIIQQETANEIIKEVEMRIEVSPTEEIRSVTEVEVSKNLEQMVQHLKEVNSTTKEIEANKSLEIMEDIQLIENSIEIYLCKNEIEERLEKLVEIGKSR